MTNKEKKAYLMGYQDKWKEIKVLQEEIETLQSRAEKITSVLSDMPHGRQGDGFVSAVDKIVELTKKLDLEVAHAISERLKIQDVIDAVENVTHRLLLRRMYINGIKLIEISTEENYSYHHICKIYGNALSELKIVKDDN